MYLHHNHLYSNMIWKSDRSTEVLRQSHQEVKYGDDTFCMNSCGKKVQIMPGLQDYARLAKTIIKATSLPISLQI